jgi:GNAT superfamily N-acetyltransferase
MSTTPRLTFDYLDTEDQRVINQAWRIPEAVGLRVTNAYELMVCLGILSQDPVDDSVSRPLVFGAVYGACLAGSLHADLLVLPAYQGLGVGRRLWDSLRWLSEGTDSIILDIRSPQVLKWAEADGFELKHGTIYEN